MLGRTFVNIKNKVFRITLDSISAFYIIKLNVYLYTIIFINKFNIYPNKILLEIDFGFFISTQKAENLIKITGNVQVTSA